MTDHTRIRKQRCPRHYASDRDLKHYAFSYVDDKGIAYYHCKDCAEVDADIYAGLKRSIEHNERQKNAAYARWLKRIDERQAARTKSMQADLWDCVVREHLAKGVKLKGYKKYQYKQALPKELLQLARITIKLQRLIKDLNRSKRHVNQNHARPTHRDVKNIR